MEALLDVQGFHIPSLNCNSEFSVKELAIANVYTREVETWIFRPPCPWEDLPAKCKATNTWIQRNYHGLTWESGDIDYNQHAWILYKNLENFNVVYVKGLQKKQWLKKTIGHLLRHLHICNLENIDCPSLKTLRVSVCKYNNHYRPVQNYMCAAENCRRLRMWFWETFCIDPDDNEICKNHYIPLEYDGPLQWRKKIVLNV